LALVLAGCAVQQAAPVAPPPQVNLSGFSPAFKQGYADGCTAARSSSPRTLPARAGSDGDYAAGWNDGYGICGRTRR
jgi:hypothetical protein